MMKRSIGERIFDYGNTLLLTILSIVTLYPLIYVLFASLSDPAYVAQLRGVMLYPKDFTLDAYKMVFTNPMISISYLNTFFYVIVGTTINILIVFTMFFEGGIIPLYLLVNEIGMLDSRWALILPTAVSAFNLIIMRTAFQAIPESLEESARIDGANDFTILFKIILPLSMPVVAVMLLFYGVYHWNSWFHAMIFIQDRELFPLQLILREILIANDTSDMMTGVGSADAMPIGETIKYATIIIATVPILLLYPFLQKYFVKGVMIGGIKE
jgi:putative aldouronate transport system permease protein